MIKTRGRLTKEFIDAKVELVELVFQSVLDSLVVEDTKENDIYSRFAACYLDIWYNDYFVQPSVGYRSTDDFTPAKFVDFIDGWITSNDEIRKTVKKAFSDSCKEGMLQEIDENLEPIEDIIWEFCEYHHFR